MTRANRCPICNGEVMAFRRYRKEAQHGKPADCGSCGKPLKRHFTNIILVLLLLIAGLILPAIWFSVAYLPVQASWALTAVVAAIYLIVWLFTTHYLTWRLIRWIPVDNSMND